MTSPASRAPRHLRRVEFEIPSPWSGTSVLRAELALDSSSDARLLEATGVDAAGECAGRRRGRLRRGRGSCGARCCPFATSLDKPPRSARKTSVSRWRALRRRRSCSRWSRSSTHCLVRLDNAYQQLEGSQCGRRSRTSHSAGDPDRPRPNLLLSRERSVPELRDVLGSNLEDLDRLAESRQ